MVAERLGAYLASIQERMRQAELAQAAASARAEEAKQTAAAAEARAGAERRARWLTAGLAAAMLALAALGGGGYSWMRQQHRAARRDGAGGQRGARPGGPPAGRCPRGRGRPGEMGRGAGPGGWRG